MSPVRPLRSTTATAAVIDASLVDAALADSQLSVLWTDTDDRPAVGAPLDGDERADLVVVGAGYTGLWAALHSLESEPSRSVFLCGSSDFSASRSQ